MATSHATSPAWDARGLQTLTVPSSLAETRASPLGNQVMLPIRPRWPTRGCLSSWVFMSTTLDDSLGTSGGNGPAVGRYGDCI